MAIKSIIFLSSQFSLTDEHITALERLVPKFRAADTMKQDQMLEDATLSIKNKWPKDAEFDIDRVTSVCELSTKLVHSQIFLARFRTYVWQSEKKTKESRIRKEKLDLS